VIGIIEQEGLDISPEAIEHIHKYLGQTAERSAHFPIPAETFNPLRNQYDAAAIIDRMSTVRPGGYDYNLYVVNLDLYAPRMNFIFGLADQLKKIALVSIYRLAGDDLITRLGKEIVHETGHLLGLRHCPDRDCVMRFSNTIADTDAKKPELCYKCRRKIETL
jgi:archaemetzincin